MKPVITRRRFSSPYSSAASGSEPIAYISRPLRMFRMYQAASRRTTIAMMVSIGMPRIDLLPIDCRPCGIWSALMRLLPVQATLMPR